MIFRIKKEDLFKEKEKYIDKLYKQNYNRFNLSIICHGLTEKEKKEIYTWNNTKGCIFYSSESSEKDKIDINTYITEYKEDFEKEQIDLMYLQRLAHFSAILPLSNILFNVENNIVENKTMNFKTKLDKPFNIDLFKKNNLMCATGLFSNNLNPLYDFSNLDKNFKNCLNIDECLKLDKILKKVSKGVKTVTKEQYIYLLEVLGKVNEFQDIIYKLGDNYVNNQKK